MMGLLDPTEDPRTMGLLAFGSSLLGSKGSFGNALGQALPVGLQAMQQVKDRRIAMEDRQQQQKARDLQMQQAQIQLAEAKRAQAEREQLAALAQQYSRSPQQQALANGQGPTVANAAAIPTTAPGFDFGGYANALAGIDPLKALSVQAALQKDDPTVALSEGGMLVRSRTGKIVANNPKAPDLNSLVVMGPDGKPMLNQLALDAKRAVAAAGAARTNVSVDAGPKAFWSDYGKQAAETLFKEREGAQSAASVLQSVQQIRGAAARGAYQGTGAELKLGAAKALGALGMPYDAATVANTEVFNAQANSFVLDKIKMLGANPSNADREFIEKTVPRLQTDPAALPALLSFIEGKAQSQIRAFNTKARGVASKPGAQFLPFDLAVPEPSSVVDFNSLRN